MMLERDSILAGVASPCMDPRSTGRVSHDYGAEHFGFAGHRRVAVEKENRFSHSLFQFRLAQMCGGTVDEGLEA